MFSSDHLRRARQEAGLTQERLADLVGVSWRSVSRWETGEGAPSVEVLVRIAEATGKRIDYFIEALA